MSVEGPNYLKQELYKLVNSDTAIFDFIQYAALDGLWFWDVDKPEEEWMNSRFWEVLGYDPAQMPHKSSAWQDIIFEEDLALALENFNRHCADPTHPYDQIVRYRHSEGHTVWIRCRGMAIRDENGRPYRMLGAHNDITEIVQAHEALAEREREAILNRVVGALAHEFNNKMTVILGLSSDLEDEYPEDTEVGYAASRIVRAADELTSVIESFLGASRDERLSMRNHALEDLAGMIRERAQAQAEDFPEGQIEIANEWPPKWFARTDHFHVGLALKEVVKNAFEAEPAGVVQVRLSVVEEGGEPRALIEVVDTGCGIPEENLPRVLHPFFSSKPATGGKGLGLTYANRITERLGGGLSIANRAEGGTRVTLEIPAHPEQD